MLIPPKSPDGTKQVFPLTTSVSGKNLAIGETDNAVLEFMPRQRGAERFVLRIDHLLLDHVGESDPLTFHARFNNTEPPGEIRADGQFGPWDDNDPAATTVSGAYTYQHVNLAAFEGIAGTLSSAGKFSGTVGHINGEGNIDVPDFKVTGSSHVVHFASTLSSRHRRHQRRHPSHPGGIACRNHHRGFARRRQGPTRQPWKNRDPCHEHKPRPRRRPPALIHRLPKTSRERRHPPADQSESTSRTPQFPAAPPPRWRFRHCRFPLYRP